MSCLSFPPVITSRGQIFLKYCTPFAQIPLDGVVRPSSIDHVSLSREWALKDARPRNWMWQQELEGRAPQLARITHVGPLAKEKREYRDQRRNRDHGRRSPR